jgi:Concanavalin A-like lectin/glucanases superfamily
MSALLPSPSLQWLFESSNVESLTGLSPSSSTTNSSTTVLPSYVAGKYGQAISFVNIVQYSFFPANSYISYSLSSGLGITVNNMTSTFWVEPLAISPVGNQTFFEIIDSTAGAIWVYNSNQSVSGGIPAVSNLNAVIVSGTVINPTNVWAHVAVTTSNVGSSVNNVFCSYYLNGKIQGTSNIIFTTLPGYISQIYMGAQQNGASQAHDAWCALDDVRIYNTALNAAQISTIYSLQGFPPQMSLTTVSAGACTMTTPLVPSSSFFLGSSSLSFGTPTSNNSVYIPASAGSYVNIGLNVPSNFSLAVSNCFLEAWLYPVSLSTSAQSIVARQLSALGTQLLITANNTTVQFGARQAVGGAVITSLNTFSLSTSTWYHIAGSWNLTTSTLNVFVNGFGGHPTTMTTPSYSSGTPTTIGGSQTSTGFNSYYIQDVRMTQGGNVPTGNFTPVPGPFATTSPTYVAGMGPVVLSLNSSYISPQSTLA